MRPPDLNLIDREKYPTAVYDSFSEPWFDSRETLDEVSSGTGGRASEGVGSLNRSSQGYRPYSLFGLLSKNLSAVAGSIFPSSLSFLRATSSEAVSLCP